LKRLSCIGYWLILLCFSGTAESQVSAHGTAARVDGVEISNAALERNFEEYQRENNVMIAAIRYPKRVSMMRREVLDRMIEREILWQAAQKKELVADNQELEEAMQQVREQFDSEENFTLRIAKEGYTVDSYRAHIRQMLSAKKYLASVASDVDVSDAECHDFYVANPEKFQLPESVWARHILLKLAPQADEETRQAVHDKAHDLLGRLQAGADFATLAREESQDSSAVQGGDLGYFPRGKMVKPFDEAAFGLQTGELSGIVESGFGLHIIKVEDRQAPQTVPEAEVKALIKAHLLQVKSQQAVVMEIAALRAAANIEVLAST